MDEVIHSSLIRKYKNNFWLLVALGVAFGLRVAFLDAQSLWNDEGTSVALSSLSIAAILNGAAKDIHPPLYYFLLHFWIPFAGITEYAVRFLSVSAGVLTVAVTYRAARAFFDAEAAILAAFLSAFSPFQIYYSQEARMYIWVTLWSAVSVWAMARILNSKSKSQPPKSGVGDLGFGIWLVYIAATIAALYTQYVGAFVVLAENFAFAVWLFFAWCDKRNAIASASASRSVNSAGQSPSNSETLAPHTSAGVATSRSFDSAAKTAAPLRASPELAEGTLLAMTGAGSIWHSVVFWVAAQILIALAFAPWYLFAGGQLASWPSIGEPLDLPTLLWRVLNTFSVGLTLDDSVAVSIALAFGIVFFIGWARPRESYVDWGVVTVILWTLVPVGAMYVVSLSRPAYNPKFLLPATPAFFILVARGLARIHPGIFERGRKYPRPPLLLSYVFWALSIIVAVGFFPPLENYYFNPHYARDDYRAIVRLIDTNERAGDGILINAPGQIDVVRYYRRGNQQLFLLPRMRPPDPIATRADVDEMLGKTKRLFAIYWSTDQSDPQRIIETRLAESAFKARDEWYGNVRLALYGGAPNPRGTIQTLDAKFGDAIVLASYQLDTREAHAGDVLTLTLNWRAEQTPNARYKTFVHLLDAKDQVVAQRDGEPVGDLRITTTWRAGEGVGDNYGIFIEPGTPPGDYRVEIGMYRLDNGMRLPIGDSDHLILGVVSVK